MYKHNIQLLLIYHRCRCFSVVKEPYFLFIVVSLKRAEHIAYGGGVLWESREQLPHRMAQHLQYL